MTLSPDERKAMRENAEGVLAISDMDVTNRLAGLTLQAFKADARMKLRLLDALDVAEHERNEARSNAIRAFGETVRGMADEAGIALKEDYPCNQAAQLVRELKQRADEEHRRYLAAVAAGTLDLAEQKAHLAGARQLLKRATEFVALVYRQGGDAGMENSGGLLDEVHAFLSVAPADSLEEKS